MTNKALSIRLSLMVVCEIALLLLVSLVVMFLYSRQALKQEAMHNAEQTLEGTVQHIDNILLSVEQSSGNIYWDMMTHLHEPNRMGTYCRRLVESCPYIASCTIAFQPNYYSGHERFLAHVHRQEDGAEMDEQAQQAHQDSIAQRPYTEQEWYSIPMETRHACWTNPQKHDNTDSEVVTTFCLPIVDEKTQQCVGVMAANLSVGLLSRIIHGAKPSEHGYSTLLSRNGSFIVHPNPQKLTQQTVFTQFSEGSNASAQEAAKAMVAGESGFKSFQLDGQDWYVMFKPFQRAKVPGRTTEELNWSIGVVYPEKDIFDGHNQLLFYVLVIAIGGLLLFYLLCRLVTHRQLQPLNQLTESAQRIAKGHYDETIPNTRREDEIGQLEDNFQQMQQSLAFHINKLEELTNTLDERSKGLRDAYHQAQEADRMKTAFLHNMTNQMIAPSDAISKSVANICNHYHDISQEQANQEVQTIQREGKTILNLLSNLLDTAENETGKEVAHE